MNAYLNGWVETLLILGALGILRIFYVIFRIILYCIKERE